MSPDSNISGDGVGDIRNVREVDSSLVTSGQPSEDQLAAVACRGVQVVINLAPHDAPSALKDEAGCLAALGLDYVHIPVAFSAPTERDLAAFFDAMDANHAQDARPLRRQQARNRVPRAVPDRQARLGPGGGVCPDAFSLGA
jgi:hypothetical protein